MGNFIKCFGLLLFLSIVIGCKQNSQNIVEKISLKCNIIDDDYLFGNPSLIAVSDSFLVVVDMSQDSLIHVFKLPDCNYIGKCGIMGQGPNEFTMISSLFDYKDNEFGIYDPNKKEIDLLNVSGSNLKLSLHTSLDNTYLHYDVRPVSEKCFIGTGIYEKGRFCILDNTGKMKGLYGQWPARDKQEAETNNRIKAQAYMGGFAVSPSGKKMIAYTMTADMIELYDFSGDSIRKITDLYKSYPDYNYKTGSESFTGTSKNTPFCYLYATCTDKYIYVLYSGKNFQEHSTNAMNGNIIYVYDWNGDNLCQYELDMNLQNICIDKTGKILYAIAYNPDPAIVKILLPNH